MSAREPFEELLDDHREIRRLSAAMVDLLGEDERFLSNILAPEVVQRLAVLETQLSALLIAHEEREGALVSGLPPDPAASALRSALHDAHAGLREVFHVLDSVTRMAEVEGAYAVRFAAWSLADHLERHLAWEEREAFPALRRLEPGVLAPGLS